MVKKLVAVHHKTKNTVCTSTDMTKEAKVLRLQAGIWTLISVKEYSWCAWLSWFKDPTSQQLCKGTGVKLFLCFKKKNLMASAVKFPNAHPSPQTLPQGLWVKQGRIQSRVKGQGEVMDGFAPVRIKHTKPPSFCRCSIYPRRFQQLCCDSAKFSERR